MGKVAIIMGRKVTLNGQEELRQNTCKIIDMRIWLLVEFLSHDKI